MNDWRKLLPYKPQRQKVMSNLPLFGLNTQSSKKVSLKPLMTSLVFILSATLLMGCQRHVVVNDAGRQCDHPPKPTKPYTPKGIAFYVASQGETIAACRALLGHVN